MLTETSAGQATTNAGVLRNSPSCRFCGSPLEITFADLRSTPLCQTVLRESDLHRMEPHYPLQGYVCGGCLLVQVPQVVPPEEIFSNYPYFSSYSDTWLEHARHYAERMIAELKLTARSQVIELASNDGYLLQNFIAQSIPALGIEPAANVAEVARRKGIPTHVAFFSEALGAELAASGIRADLLLGNNVLAHVPDLNGFLRGMKHLLKPAGTITMEFPHLMRLVQGRQFDTIYHEHFSYFSLLAVERIFRAHGLVIFDVEQLSTHGGSLRIFARHEEDPSRPVSARVAGLLGAERSEGMESLDYYRNFDLAVQQTKRKLLECLIRIKQEGKTIAGYGAAGKGNTLLNYCGLGRDFIDYVVDRNVHKQGNYLPGSRIPIYDPDQVRRSRPDYLLILPWNLKDEIMRQMAYVREWGGSFIIPIPEPIVC